MAGGTSHKQSRTVFVLLCLAWFTPCRAFRAPPGRGVRPSSVTLQGAVLGRCPLRARFAYLLSVDRCSAGFHLWAVVSSAAVNMGVQLPG